MKNWARNRLLISKKQSGLIFQEYFLLDSLTVRENIAVPLTLLHKPAKEIDKKVTKLAELFGIGSQLNKYPVNYLEARDSVWQLPVQW